VRDGHRNPLHRHVRAGVPAGGAELRRYCPQIPADSRTGPSPGQDVPALRQAVTGTGVTPGVPAQLVPDIVAIRRGPVCGEQGKERHLVLVRFGVCLRHARSIASASCSPAQWHMPEAIALAHIGQPPSGP
jgi:hypothetical protein